MYDAIVRTARMVNLQKLAEMSSSSTQDGNRMDCRPEFIDAVSHAITTGNAGFGQFRGILAPFINRTKADIAFRALSLGVPLEETWSCYKGGDKHCGKCGTCVERLEAIAEAQDRHIGLYGQDSKTQDRTDYADIEFWKEAVSHG